MAKADIQEQYGLFINGEFVPASDGATFDAHNPANGEHLAYFAEATKEDVDSAVKAARAALPAWSKTSPIERQNILLKIADIIDANADHLALVETLDNGKPIRETKAADISATLQAASVHGKALPPCWTTTPCPSFSMNR